MPFSKGKVRIYYEVSGDGPPLVLIHANPYDHRLWTYKIQTFSQMYRTIAVDIRYVPNFLDAIWLAAHAGVAALFATAVIRKSA